MNEYYQKYLKYKKKYLNLKIQKAGYDELDNIREKKSQIQTKIDAVTKDIEGLENELPQFTPEQEKIIVEVMKKKIEELQNYDRDRQDPRGGYYSIPLDDINYGYQKEVILSEKNKNLELLKEIAPTETDKLTKLEKLVKQFNDNMEELRELELNTEIRVREHQED
jgi:tRNA/tmRNA/rRNA uracil-C5-methylase (TrmA/RlmC/RlmD family)